MNVQRLMWGAHPRVSTMTLRAGMYASNGFPSYRKTVGNNPGCVSGAICRPQKVTPVLMREVPPQTPWKWTGAHLLSGSTVLFRVGRLSATKQFEVFGRLSGSLQDLHTSAVMTQELEPPRRGRSAASRMAVEHAAKHLIRQAIQPSEGFCGLEEPAVALPHLAKTDMALRPCGSKDDLWLPLQVKAASRPTLRSYRNFAWVFEGVPGYEGMLVTCIALQDGQIHTRSCFRGHSPEAKPRVWVFPGCHLNNFSRSFTLTQGGRHDTETSRCSFQRSEKGRFLGDVLFSVYQKALTRPDSISPTDSVRLESLATLRKQVSPACQTELETLSWFGPFFKAAGLETVDAPCPSLPYDILARDASHVDSKPIRLQMKTAYWMSWGNWGPLAHVNSNRKVGTQSRVPYTVDDFDFLLVGPPRNQSRLLSMHRERYGEGLSSHTLEQNLLDPFFFYMFSSQDLQRLGLVTCGSAVGKKGFNLDFAELPEIPRDRESRAPRVFERLSFRYSSKPDSASLTTAVQLLSAHATSHMSRPSISIRQLSTSLSIRDVWQAQRGAAKRGRSAAENMDVEHRAKNLIRKAIKPSHDFRGMEESPVSLPATARADMALRPFGCQKDSWLAVQVKATQCRGTRGNSVFWDFVHVDGYESMIVVCVSLEENTGFVADIFSPLAWMFPGSYFCRLKHLKITEGGQHDSIRSRCGLQRHEGMGGSLGEKLLSAYEEAASFEQSSCNNTRLFPFRDLQSQISTSFQTEMQTQQWFQPVFDAMGLEDASAHKCMLKK
uniref:Uncharacterized protein n=1 Tax=Chromera velia CCMP2878 TaxID=1169474 RepID=A0A0G4HCN9_9ALVE|eukprot:Cvel_6341.t1-p1 / transcript=Cvel_6341.t1 / gene=Cvel_6341 / organism=Chromera_velia_CCMP2878 / gene_product=hypothetical protein / transcript_product=hypothetical protein / location=Cvel_scaffold308:13029-17390(-) / protein_length=776 / sequence_SO=supercontig / SO=protein_coding / is_pseudo=false